MNREKVIELAREAEILRQLPMEVPFVVDRLERFAALVEHEVIGDAEPIGEYVTKVWWDSEKGEMITEKMPFSYLQKNDCEPVFPTIHNGSTLPGERGMTLRDWFAGMAMQGMLACGEQHDANTSSVLSEDAYKIADAMLKAQTVTES